MKRAIVLSALFALCGLTGCSGSTTTPPDASAPQLKIEDLLPGDNVVTGWAVDTTQSPSGPEIYKTRAEIDSTSIDGDVVPFQNKGFTAVARQFYKSGTYSAEMRVWQMNDASKATAVYASVLSDPPSTHYSSITFAEMGGDAGGTAIGAASRYGFQYPQWLVDCYQGVYFLEIRVKPSTLADDAAHTGVLPLLQWQVAKIK